MQKMKNFRKTAEKRSKMVHEKDRILHVFS